MWRDRCKPDRERGSGTQRDPLTHLILQCCPARLAGVGGGGKQLVISPTGEVWCGVGSPSVRRWHATPTVHIYHAATPGWASLDGLTPVTVPLADIETALTL